MMRPVLWSNDIFLDTSPWPTNRDLDSRRMQFDAFETSTYAKGPEYQLFWITLAHMVTLRAMAR